MGIQTLASEQLAQLKKALDRGERPARALPACVGGASVGEGRWRFFSESHPQMGIASWNEAWRTGWSLKSEDVFAFGEDVFGNQLVVRASGATVFLCNHEDGVCFDLEMNPAELLEMAAKHGLSWIDFYEDGSLDVAKPFLPKVTWENHLHWTTPLILNGRVEEKNLTLVDRLKHLSGHAQLWRQISDLPPGTEVVP